MATFKGRPEATDAGSLADDLLTPQSDRARAPDGPPSAAFPAAMGKRRTVNATQDCVCCLHELGDALKHATVDLEEALKVVRRTAVALVDLHQILNRIQ
ncbi:hypothetical protein ACFOW4_10640 [Micromonospora sp. GCM10011542]|uniref:hypothetical protein n=1 Tax=Micromonospora sp. GCM10011542 TaxID=3317337 RepID=UPI00360646F7